MNHSPAVECLLVAVGLGSGNVYVIGRKDILFNDALNTFYLRTYSIGHMIKDHSDSERENPLLPLHKLLILISSKGSFICIIPQRG